MRIRDIKPGNRFSYDEGNIVVDVEWVSNEQFDVMGNPEFGHYIDVYGTYTYRNGEIVKDSLPFDPDYGVEVYRTEV